MEAGARSDDVCVLEHHARTFYESIFVHFKSTQVLQRCVDAMV